MWRWCDSNIVDAWISKSLRILVTQCSKMIFSGHSCIIPSPEWLQVSPDPPLGGCFSDDGKRCNISNYYHSNDPWGPNAQTCNVHLRNLNSSGCLTNTGERQVQRVGVCQTRNFMSHLQPAPQHPSHQVGMQHTSNSVSGGWYTHQRGLCDLLTTSWRSHLYKWMVELKDQHCYQPCCCSVTFRGQCFQPGLFASTKLTQFFNPIKHLIFKYRSALARMHLLLTITREHM